MKRGLVLSMALMSAVTLLTAPLKAPAQSPFGFGASTYTKTRYPIVLAHGLSGFDRLFGVVEMFFGIERELESGGATVFITEASQFNSSEVRGEQLIEQIEEILAISGATKVNLIGHSQGGLDARYVAAVRPELIASVTAIATPHQGSGLSDTIRELLPPGSDLESGAAKLFEKLGSIIGIFSMSNRPQDALAALNTLSSEGLAQFNADYPLGLPTTSCGAGPALVDGIRYYSWSGTSVFTNVLDVSDLGFGLTSTFATEANDGLVGRCSSHFGEVIRDNYGLNHLDEVNHVLGLVGIFGTNPKAIFRQHANRLKEAGL